MNDYGASQPVPAIVTLVEGMTITGQLHVSPGSPRHPGAETPLELLNRREPFFPLTQDDGRAIFIAKRQVAFVECRTQPERGRSDPRLGGAPHSAGDHPGRRTDPLGDRPVRAAPRPGARLRLPERRRHVLRTPDAGRPLVDQSGAGSRRPLPPLRLPWPDLIDSSRYCRSRVPSRSNCGAAAPPRWLRPRVPVPSVATRSPRGRLSPWCASWRPCRCRPPCRRGRRSPSTTRSAATR